MPTSNVINAVTASYNLHNKSLSELKNDNTLRKILSKKYQIFPSIYFSNNTTTVLINILNLLSKQNDKKRTLFFSDLEHPCILKAINSVWPGNKKMLRLHHLMLAGDLEMIEDRLSKINTADDSIVIISQVLWNSGLILNVADIVQEIKHRNLNTTIIVDGAQAVGNIEINLKKDKKNQSIDFYIGCLHKWVGIKTIVGFASINNAWVKKNIKLSKNLFLTDRFSSFAGSVSYIKESDINIATYDLCLLKSIINEINTKGKKRENEKYKNMETNKHLNKVPAPDYRYSNFIGYYSTKQRLLSICKKEMINTANMSTDTFLPHNNYWLRIIKPKSYL